MRVVREDEDWLTQSQQGHPDRDALYAIYQEGVKMKVRQPFWFVHESMKKGLNEGLILAYVARAPFRRKVSDAEVYERMRDTLKLIGTLDDQRVSEVCHKLHQEEKIPPPKDLAYLLDEHETEGWTTEDEGENIDGSVEFGRLLLAYYTAFQEEKRLLRESDYSAEELAAVVRLAFRKFTL